MIGATPAQLLDEFKLPLLSEAGDEFILESETTYRVVFAKRGEYSIFPGETILHASQRKYGDWPQHWRVLAAYNSVRDPFQNTTMSQPFPIAGGVLLRAHQKLEEPA